VSEFLRFVPKEDEANLSFDELIAMGKILAPGFLWQLVGQAKEYLMTEPGPNLFRRQMLVPEWLGYWMTVLQAERDFDPNTGSKLVESDRIMTISEMKNRFKKLHRKGIISGVWFMGTGEAGPGHRMAWYQASRRVRELAMLYEGEDYFDKHPDRRRPCLPEAIRASLAGYYGLRVSRVPDRPDGVSEAKHYREVFRLTGATVNFVTRGYPNEKAVLARNSPKMRRMAVVEDLVRLHTSEMTEKLMPDVILIPARVRDCVEK